MFKSKKVAKEKVRFSQIWDAIPSASAGYIPIDSGFGLGFPYSRSVGYLPLYNSPYRPAYYRDSTRHRGDYLPSLVNMHFLTAALKNLEPRIDDDLVDRLNYYYTPSVIVIFAILVSAKQYVGHPIECWVPAQFTRAMEQYTENYCWVQNTYWIPFTDLIPSLISQRERRQIGYYQWVPFILGINIHGILQMVSDEHNVEPENRLRTAHILARHIDDALRYQRDFGSKSKSIYLWAFVRIGKYYGAYVSMVYCFVKLLYLANLIGQFFLLNRVLETDQYPYYGANVLWDLLHGNEWQNSGKFPRVTLCDFEIRVLGNIHRHTVQCVLVINLFTEKIFIFLWLWMLLLGMLCIISFFYWITSLIIPSLRITFIQHHLELTDNAPLLMEEEKLHKFVLDFLRPDGVFILRMIQWHGGTVLCTEIAHLLWTRFKESKNLKPPEIPKDLKRPSILVSSMQELIDQGAIFEEQKIERAASLHVPDNNYPRQGRRSVTPNTLPADQDEEEESDPDEIILQVPSIRPPQGASKKAKKNPVFSVSKKLKTSLRRKDATTPSVESVGKANSVDDPTLPKKSTVCFNEGTSEIV